MRFIQGWTHTHTLFFSRLHPTSCSFLDQTLVIIFAEAHTEKVEWNNKIYERDEEGLVPGPLRRCTNAVCKDAHTSNSNGSRVSSRPVQGQWGQSLACLLSLCEVFSRPRFTFTCFHLTLICASKTGRVFKTFCDWLSAVLHLIFTRHIELN